MTKRLSKLASDLLVVTTGEPAGIGPELCLSLAGRPGAGKLVIIADPDMLRARAALLGLSIPMHKYAAGKPLATVGLNVLPHPLARTAVCGKPDPANAKSLLSGLRRAVDGCLAGEFAAMVTAPLQKSMINDAGIPFTGHTEYLAALTDTKVPVMLLVANQLRVALVTTHLPLRDVAASLSTEAIVAVLEVLHTDLSTKFNIAEPQIVVCGLNPHAGEGGHLGGEDEAIIRPAVERCRAQGMAIRGPLPADTAFTPAAGNPHAILAMYHDQGLPVIKHAGFGKAVNVTLGLPVTRTSVDHGTALDLAGKGSADPGSLLAAIDLAAELAAG